MFIKVPLYSKHLPYYNFDEGGRIRFSYSCRQCQPFLRKSRPPGYHTPPSSVFPLVMRLLPSSRCFSPTQQHILDDFSRQDDAYLVAVCNLSVVQQMKDRHALVKDYFCENSGCLCSPLNTDHPPHPLFCCCPNGLIVQLFSTVLKRFA